MKESRTILAELAAPFAAEDLEWRLQVAYEDSMRGIAVPYVTNRAIQNRLDEVVGPDRWYNEYKPWHSAGKKEAQICGLSIFFEERGWITKWDGSEDSDIEPVKGGLSDSMKRAAVQWGIGRVLYSMDTVWVAVEKKGKSCTIQSAERAKLDKAYLNTLSKLNLKPAQASGIQSLLVPREDGNVQSADAAVPSQQPHSTEQTTRPTVENHAGKSPTVSTFPSQSGAEQQKSEFTVMDAKVQNGMNGITTQLVLQDNAGKKALGFIRGEHAELRQGARLHNVQKQLKQQDSVVFYLLNSFEIAQDEAA